MLRGFTAVERFRKLRCSRNYTPNIMKISMESTIKDQGVGSKILMAAIIVLAAAGGIALFLWWVYSLR